jgi:four helix bundle protein
MITKQRYYEKLIVWKEAHALCLSVYKITAAFPSSERFALVVQMRKSSSSVSTNIVEGNGRRTLPQKLRFAEIAEGSLDELDYQLLLSFDLGYINKEKFDELRSHAQRVKYLLSQFRAGIKKYQ